MMNMKTLALLLCLSFYQVNCSKKPVTLPGYAQNPRAELTRLQSSDRRHTLVVFGADWCGDCKVLYSFLRSEAVQKMLSEHFKLMLVDVKDFSRNLDFAADLEIPMNRGIPALAVVDTAGTVIASTRAGEFATARTLNSQALIDWLGKVL